MGGSGSDTFIVSSLNTHIEEAPNSGNNTEEISGALSGTITLANNVQNLTAIGTANLTLKGNNLANVITANSGNDTLIAGSGADTLIAGSGNDKLNAGTGTSTLVGGTGNDTLTGSGSTKTTYQFNTGSGNLTVQNTGANDVVQFGSGITAANVTATEAIVSGNPVVTLAVAGGKSMILNSPTLNTVKFGDGSSTTLAAMLTVSSATSITLAAGKTNLVLTGTANITGTGNTLPNTITANSGNDTLTAGSGLATLIGGSGNDTFIINTGNDVIVEAPNTGNNTEQTSDSVGLANNVQNLVGTGSAALTLIGNNIADTITANSGNDNMWGGGEGAAVTLIGGTGQDWFYGQGDGSKSTYEANTGNGNLNIDSAQANDVLLFGSGITAASLSAATSVVGGNTMLVITESNGKTVTVNETDSSTSFNTAHFSDGSSATFAALVAQTASSISSGVSITMPAGVTKLTLTGTANITGTGNTLADTIIANSGNDVLISGTGIDTLVGGAGNDTFVINNSNDVITVTTAKAGNVTQSAVSFVLPANLLNLTGTGTAAINLTGNTLADTITANSGNDTLTSGTGVDTLVGGTGSDTFVINNSSDAITVSSAKTGNIVQSSVNYVLPTNLLSLTGTGTKSITMTGNASANTITANSGNDTLTAGSGLATLIGGTGNDTFVVNNASDVITEAVNSGNNTESTSVAVTLAANVQNLVATGTTAIKLTGNTGTDVITGNSGNDTLAAGSGSDTLIAGTGSTKTTMTGGAGNDTFVINNAGDTITATAGSNINTVQTSVSFTAPTNVQDLFGTGSTAIALTGNTVNNLLIGNSGNDTLTAGSGIAVMEAGSGTDVLKDTASANALIGGSGNDTMTGGTGASFIVGGAGNDGITLGAGTAVVAFNTGAGKATIAPGTGVSNVLSLGGGIAYANLAFSKSGNNLILSTGGNNTITLTNWYAATADQNFVTLQVIEQAASTYSATSTNTLYSSEVEEFSFTQLVTAFNAALTANPSLTSWSLSNSLLTDHLSSSNTVAVGGDLAYYDGLNGNLTGMNMATADTTLQSSTFGKTAQTIDAWSGISAGTNKLH